MKFRVEKLPQAEKEYDSLSAIQKKAVDADYTTIEEKGIEYVKRRYLREGLFEIKTNDVRSLFKYEEDCVILIGLIYTKKTKKAPKQLIELAEKRLKGR